MLKLLQSLGEEQFAAHEKERENFVGLLQERRQRADLPLPVYADVGSAVDANGVQIFTVSCICDGTTCLGSAPSKKEAKQNAAEQMLAELEATD